MPSFRGLHINHPWFGLALGRNLDYLSKVESQLYTSKTRSVEANLQQLDTVNMSDQAALKSQDIAQVKKGRAVIKGQLNTAVKRVEVLFSKKVGDDFDHRSISKTEVKNIEAKMNENFDMFQKLHDKCCELREPGADETEE